MLITVANFRQFTCPYVLDSLKPQLKLVQSSVGDQEVMDSFLAVQDSSIGDLVTE